MCFKKIFQYLMLKLERQTIEKRAKIREKNYKWKTFFLFRNLDVFLFDCPVYYKTANEKFLTQTMHIQILLFGLNVNSDWLIIQLQVYL